MPIPPSVFVNNPTTDLPEQGMPFDQANSIALYEWVDLPDLDNLDEAMQDPRTHPVKVRFSGKSAVQGLVGIHALACQAGHVRQKRHAEA